MSDAVYHSLCLLDLQDDAELLIEIVERGRGRFREIAAFVCESLLSLMSSRARGDDESSCSSSAGCKGEV